MRKGPGMMQIAVMVVSYDLKQGAGGILDHGTILYSHGAL